MTDSFAKFSRSLTSPPEAAAAILPDDAAPLAHVPRAIFVGTGGDLRVRMLRGGAVTLVNVASGSLVPLRVTHVHATGTTAADLVALW